MAFPPPVQRTAFANADPQLDLHPTTHVQIATAINDITAATKRSGIWRAGASLSFPSGATTIAWTSTAQDTGGFATNATDATVPTGGTGLYVAHMFLTVTTVPSAVCFPSIVINGTAVYPPGAIGQGYVISTGPIPMGEGTVLRATFYNGGTPLVGAAQFYWYRVAP